MRILINGAAGRMGLELQACVLKDSDLTAAALIERPESAVIGGRGVSDALPPYTSDLESAAAGADVIVDFTTQPAFQGVLRAAVNAKIAVVSGTTGLSEADQESLAAAAEVVPVVYSPNMSVGIQVMLELLRRAATALGPDYDVELVETHHRRKIDAPSGTAKRLHAELSTVVATNNEIPVHAIRGGDVVGDHSAHFMGPGDRIEITHRATTRRTFAAGAVRAAKWVIGKPPGLYDMKDVLEDTE